MKIVTTLAIIFLMLLPLCLYAQGGPLDTADTPVDGGLSLLLVAGISYGAKKIYSKGNNK